MDVSRLMFRDGLMDPAGRAFSADQPGRIVKALT